MLNNTFGIILTGAGDASLNELTRARSIAALPIAGRYRMIDVVLSNLVNAGIENVGVITQRNYHSIMDHLSSGKEWDLSRKRDGLFILPPYASSENRGTYTGLLDALRSNINYIRRSSQKYVLICGSDTLYNVDFNAMMEAHMQSKADITLLYHRSHAPSVGMSYLGMDKDGRVDDIEIDPIMPRNQNVFVGTFLMEKALLLYMMDMALAHGKTDLLRDAIQNQLGLYRVYGYEAKGYLGVIDSVQSYFNVNMDLLNNDIRRSIFSGERPVYTKIKDEAPAKYEGEAQARNSLLADGCVIEGTVENCVLFRGVRIGRGAVVKNSIIMQASSIGDGCRLENVILDKNVHIRRDQNLMGTANFPVVVGKNMII